MLEEHRKNQNNIRSSITRRVVFARYPVDHALRFHTESEGEADEDAEEERCLSVSAARRALASSLARCRSVCCRQELVLLGCVASGQSRFLARLEWLRPL